MIEVGILISASAAFAQVDWIESPWAEQHTTPTTRRALAEVPRDSGPASPKPSEVIETSKPDRNWAAEQALTDVTNPWPGRSEFADSGSGHQAAATAQRATKSWVRPLNEIIDPWASLQSNSWAREVDIVVDPWAAGAERR
jgi:hypothetical protein